MQLSRLSGRKVCERVKNKGALWKGRHMFIRTVHGAPWHLREEKAIRMYVGVLTSSKLDASAVKRNRMRRRCREALRVTLKNEKLSSFLFPLSSSYQLLILPRSSSLLAPFGELLADAASFLSSLTSGARRLS